MGTFEALRGPVKLLVAIVGSPLASPKFTI